jgi:hypothetical protein
MKRPHWLLQIKKKCSFQSITNLINLDKVHTNVSGWLIWQFQIIDTIHTLYSVLIIIVHTGSNDCSCQNVNIFVYFWKVRAHGRKCQWLGNRQWLLLIYDYFTFHFGDQGSNPPHSLIVSLICKCTLRQMLPS